MPLLKIGKDNINSALLKGLNILCTLLLVRFTIKFVGEETYGIWLAILSFITWFSSIEVGITNSLRNSITTFFSDKNLVALRSLIGKGYKKLSVSYLIAIIVLTTSIYLFDLELLFKPNGSKVEDLSIAATISITLYFLHYIFFFLNSILLSTHQPVKTYLLALVQNLVVLFGIVFFIYSDAKPTLILICIWFSAVPLLTWMIGSLILFRTRLHNLKPHFSASPSKKEKNNKGLFISFLTIQISLLIIFSTDNLIIINFLNGEEVTKYAISFRYFNLITVLFNLILLPYWASFAEAMHRKDKTWIRKTIRKLVNILVTLALASIIMLTLANPIYSLWLGYEVNIPFALSGFTALSILLTAWYSIFSYFLNSINEVKNQRNWITVSAVLNLALSLILIKLLGTSGVILATCISMLPVCIALPIQYNKIMSRL